MLLYPDDLYEKLEFDKILERLSSFCMGVPAKQQVNRIRLFNHREKISLMLDEILEFQKTIDLGADFPLSHYESIIDQLGLLRKEGYVLEIEEYFLVYNHIRMIHEMDLFFDTDRQAEFPILYKISSQISLDEVLLKSFYKVFTEDGKIKPNASPELKKIFDSIRSKEREIERVFKQLATKYKQSGYLTENVESVKNSRRVLSVNAENKRKIKGIIHDESTTGKTVFIEPAELTELNNDLYELEASKRHEVYKILKSLSDQLRPHLDDILLAQRIIVRFDLIRAKAKFAKTYDGNKPILTEDKEMVLKDVYHPLLYIMNQEMRRSTVPYDLSLDAKKRFLVISGPNAGGKTVTLKALGLNQLMLQSGMLIPVRDDSKLMIFNKIMIDIGDQQSIEGDLSTYSSRLLNMKYFAEKSDRKTLILIDEFGSGSDPKMGGAIAEAVLDTIIKRKCMGIITTHYSNIKNYAYKCVNILNGAMQFDKDELQPTFKLKVGQPGSSFAFEIANKIGLPKAILKYAKNLTGKDNNKVDRLLIDLQHEKKVLEEKLLENYDESYRLNKLIKNYESMKEELSIRRKRLKLEAKEKTYLNLSDYERELQKLIGDLKKEKNVEKAKSTLKEVKEKRRESKTGIKEIAQEVFKEQIQEVKDLQVGQYVKLRSGGESGKVVGFTDKKVKLEMGIMKFEVPRSEIIMANEPIHRIKKTITTDTVVNPQTIDTSLDIRGYSKQEAEDSMQEFIDNALMASVLQLKVVHGKGSGVLKKVVWKKAKEYKDIKKMWHPTDDFGGQGVTFISF